MLKRKRLIRKLALGIVSLFLILFGISWVSNTVTKRLPVSPSQIRLAQNGIAQNADWNPTLHHFNSLDWALVPAGCFHVGSTEKQMEEALRACKTYGGENCPYVFDRVETPEADFCFEKPYWIGVTEITNRQYGSSSSTDMVSMYRGPSWPRETVTWHEAVRFCRSIGSRLPTEAEWEYAARGPDNLIFPWANEMSLAYRDEVVMLNPYDVEAIEVDISWVGAQGMSGNVMEWVADAFDPASTPRPVSPKIAQSHEFRIVRGGSWAAYQDFLLRTTQRIPYEAGYASSVIGFRCAHDFEEIP